MTFDPKLILILLATISTSLASLNGQCSGRNGICIKTSSCTKYNGQSYSGKCPSDPNDVKCCDEIPCSANGKSGKCIFASQCNGESVSGLCPGGNDFKCCLSGGSTPSTPTEPSEKDNTYNGPCGGGGGVCINTNRVSCETRTIAGKCRGPAVVKCCVSGKKPSWYINQGQYTKTTCLKDRTVKTSGCGPSSLAMGIRVLTNNNISPETLFKEGCDAGLYHGDGYSHHALSTLAKKHGVKISWTSNVDSVYTALTNGKGVIFHVGPESKYHFTKGGHYIFLYGAKTQNGVKKVYVFDPNGSNNYINVLFPLKRGDGGIEIAAKGNGADFAIISKN